jgi:hypothetical protein
LNFINYTNHPSAHWSQEEIDAAMQYAGRHEDFRIIDIPFPAVDPREGTEYIIELSRLEAQRIIEYNPVAVLCQGEMTLSFSLVKRLMEKGIKVLATCSRRDTIEQVDAEGGTIKQARFIFERFREYERV